MQAGFVQTEWGAPAKKAVLPRDPGPRLHCVEPHGSWC